MRKQVVIFIAALATAACALYLAGCSSEKVDASSQAGSTAAAESTAKEQIDSPEQEAQPFAVGDTVQTDAWNITLTDTYLTNKLVLLESFPVEPDNENATLLVLEVDVECLTSDDLSIEEDALTDIIATYQNNTYKKWKGKYCPESYVQMPLTMNPDYFNIVGEFTQIDAGIPQHIYLHTNLPISAESDNEPITVSLEVAGQQKTINVR